MSETNETRDYEAEARGSGWVPQDAWKGAPDRWVDAQTFVERGEQFLPFVQAKFKKSLDTIDKLQSQVDELKAGNEEFRRFHETALARQKREHEETIARLEEQRRKAVSEGDGDAFDKADKALQDARNQPVGQPAAKAATVNPDVQAWMAENPWYTADRQLKAITDGLSDDLAAEQPTLKGRPFLDELAKRVKAAVPHKFTTQRPTTTEGHGNGGGSSKKDRSYEALPAEAKAACDRFVKTIPGFTKEAYLSQYDWS